MADVKWQLQKTAGMDNIQVRAETTEDTVDAPGLEKTSHEEIQYQLAHPSVKGRETTRVLATHELYPEEGASELVAEGAESTQHKEVL